MAVRNKRHLIIPATPLSDPFTIPTGGGGSETPRTVGNRTHHGMSLKSELEDALQSASGTEATDEIAASGTYVSFESFPGIELALASLDPRPRGSKPVPELLAVNTMFTEVGEQVEIATVFVPDGGKRYLFKRLDDYIATSESSSAKHRTLVESIRSIRRATLRELWTDPMEEFPDVEHRAWWEIWLRRRDGQELQRLSNYAQEHNLSMSRHQLGFGDRLVTLVHASIDELGNALESLDDFAELRRPPDIATFLSDEPASEQSEWIEDLLARVIPADASAPVACVIDTGVQQGHPLLRHSLDNEDVHVINPAWSTRDKCGHGTEIAGLALYGDLATSLQSAEIIALRHRLESVKFLQDCSAEGDDNQKDVYGAITAQAVDRPEIQAPERGRVFVLTSTSPRPIIDVFTSASITSRTEAGRPTSWSAAIDAMAAGRAIEIRDGNLAYLDPESNSTGRLFILAAGNIRDLAPHDDPLVRADLEPIEDPAQAWNAVTVGAFTELDSMTSADPSFDGYVPLVPRGELAPSSRTSVLFNQRKWPVKPDVVAEGGNYAVSPDRTTVDSPDCLAVLTTRRQHAGQGPLTTSRDTSAATAQVAATAADIMAEYPQLRPETVRGLIVHSAEWTDSMQSQLNGAHRKEEIIKILRRYGMGIPSLERALRSASDALTLIAESTIQPFEHTQGQRNDGRTKEMHLHDLPWPIDVLE